jgi:hypothetical protein
MLEAGMPFGSIREAGDLVRVYVCLLPLIAGGVWLPARRYWVSGVACWVVLFAFMTMMAYKGAHRSALHGLCTERYY